MIGSRAWYALMKRNWIYKRRNWISTLLEVFLPTAFVGILLAIKNASKDSTTDTIYRPTTVPDQYQTFIPFSFTDYTIALQAKRTCLTYGDSDFEISGIANNGNSWPVPLVKCDSRKCDLLGQDARPFCEYNIIGVAPKHRTSVKSKERTEDFLRWLYTEYPVLGETRNRIAQRNRSSSTSSNTSSSNNSSTTMNTTTTTTDDDDNTVYASIPVDYDIVQLFRDTDDIDQYVRLPNYGIGPNNPKIALAIVWDVDDNDSSSSTTYRYSIRQNSTNFNAPEGETDSRISVVTTPNTKQLFSSYAKSDNDVCALPDIDSPKLGKNENSCTAQYLYNGVITIQRLVHDYILYDTGAAANGYSVSNNGVGITQLPTKPFYVSGFFKQVEDTSPILLLLGLLYPIAIIISSIVYEKEVYQKVLMKIMSVYECDINQSWFMTFFMIHIVTATICTIVSSLLYTYTSIYLLLLLWQSFFLSSIVFAMFISSFMNKSNRAVLIGILVYFSGVFLSLAVDVNNTDNTVLLQVLSLHPTTAFSFAIKIISVYEDQRIGLTSDNVNQSPSENGRSSSSESSGGDNDGYSFQTSIMFLLIDVLLYSFLTFYLNRIISPSPDQYGQPLYKPWFIFQSSYWFPNHHHNNNNTTTAANLPIHQQAPNNDTNNNNTDEMNIPIEPVSSTLLKQTADGTSIEIQNLYKVYGNNEKIAVQNLNLSIYSNQITTLLGHNGAGKTTTIHLLTGLLTPTSGTITIHGQDVRTQMNSIRQDIGICFQNDDCLFYNVTVLEHIQFYTQIKGVYDKKVQQRANASPGTIWTMSIDEEIENEIVQSLHDVGLYDKRHTVIQQLSGGMKRKLSVAIAFCGNSKIVLLDEPTSGMDPYSRRMTWNIIRQYRNNTNTNNNNNNNNNTTTSTAALSPSSAISTTTTSTSTRPKINRCIILTTHFMDEADILSDRIAILSNGQLCCYGSSLFLKKYYGVGYQLTIATNPSLLALSSSTSPKAIQSTSSTDQHPDVLIHSATNLSSSIGEETIMIVPEQHKQQQHRRKQQRKQQPQQEPQEQSQPQQVPMTIETVQNIVLTSVPEAILLNDIIKNNNSNSGTNTTSTNNNTNTTSTGIELCYQLPVSSSYKFIPMFIQLDELIDTGYVTNYGISVTTMDEVFVLVTRQHATTKISTTGTTGTKPSSASSSLLLKAASTATTTASATNNPRINNTNTRSNGNGNRVVRNNNNNNQFSLSDDQSIVSVTASERTIPTYQLEQSSIRLFTRHVCILFYKRYINFKRDKVAWVCTTIIPSVFVCIGFLIFLLLDSTRDLQPLTLSLQDYNVDVDEIPINPIFYNNPNNPYQCSPGSCAYQEPLVNEALTGEQYVYCGYVAKIGSVPNTTLDHYNVTCNVPWTEQIMSTLEEMNSNNNHSGIANPIMTDVTSVLESSYALLNTSNNTFAATQYGAIWFTHLPNSTVATGNNDNLSYQQLVQAQCNGLLPQFNYTPPNYCNSFGNIGYVVAYNFTALHVTPLFITLADEAIVRFGSNNPNINIITTIAPLPITADEKKVNASEDALTTWFLIILSFPFIAGTYGSFIVMEKSTKAKHLQTVAGIHSVSYWLSTYLWDIMNYQFPLWITIALMYAFNVQILITNERDVVTGIISLLILFGPASAGYTYCISFFFTSASLCNVSIIISGFLIGLGGPLACYILQLLAADKVFPKPHLADVATILEWILRIFPQFCLGKGLFNTINIETFMYLEKNVDLTVWDPAILLYEVYFLALESIVYIVLTILIDIAYTNPKAMSYMRWFTPVTYYYIIKQYFAVKKSANNTSSFDDDTTADDMDLIDDDVRAEQERIANHHRNSTGPNNNNNNNNNNDLIVIDNITKTYPNGKKAVKQLSLGIPSGQCFGLLGINGAGKTTTMGILTAEFPPSTGDVYMLQQQYSVVKQPEKIRRHIGYCPQFDAHFLNLTGKEHVELYATIKGVPYHLVSYIADRTLEQVGITLYDSNRLCSTYSGGMKRRLSLACATVGLPQLIMLDEPCTGVDPVSRREIWQFITNIVNGSSSGIANSNKPSIVLTTHSMEECETLCPRIGIMANGKLCCIGSAQHLKNKFGKGYQIELKTQLVKPNVDDDYKYIYNQLLLSQQQQQQQRTNKKNHNKNKTKSNVNDNNDDDHVDDEIEKMESTISFTVDECREALRTLSNPASMDQLLVFHDTENNHTSNNKNASLFESIVDTIQPDDPNGHTVWSTANSPTGVSIVELSIYIATAIRIINVDMFMDTYFPNHVLRERQDTKSRYEIDRTIVINKTPPSPEGIVDAAATSTSTPTTTTIRISDIFTKIEHHKESLRIADYSVSQTSLEQVFNMHAESATQSHHPNQQQKQQLQSNKKKKQHQPQHQNGRLD